MMNFDERWKIAAAAAQRANPEMPAEMPPGFATRVFACWRAQPALSPTMIWQVLALRVLGAMALVLLALAALEFAEAHDRDGWRPAMGDAVGEHFWML